MYLIVGGDSLLGAELVNRLGPTAFHTTRRSDTSFLRRSLDFTTLDDFEIPQEVDYAFLVASISNYGRCEIDPEAKRINTDLIPQLAAKLIGRGIHVCFISSNSVFGGEVPWPDESDTPDPKIAYAKQKFEAENLIKAVAYPFNAEKVTIVRITKLLPASPIPEWLETWGRGEVVRPFADLVFSPLSVQYAARSIIEIAKSRQAGKFHLSGAQNISYAEFCYHLAQKVGAKKCHILPTTSTDQNVKILFRPSYSGLGMKRTTELGIYPQTVDSVLEDVLVQMETA